MSESSEKALIEARELCKYFDVGGNRHLKAVDGVSFAIGRGETLGLVGESGCGKSTVGRALLHMIEPTSGETLYEGEAVTAKNLAAYRHKMQMVFQDPYSSLDPRMTCADLIMEPLLIMDKHQPKQAQTEKLYALLDTVGLKREHARRYPHEFSGGQRQRIGIARALAMNPSFIVCDEPVSALDVSVKAQIINMFGDIQRDRNLSYLFITHDLLTARYISHRIAVMYLGRIVEMGNVNEVIDHPVHPYTKALFSAVTVPDPARMREKSRIALSGEIPSPLHVPSGCAFRTRCPYACEDCAAERPALMDIGGGHMAACRMLIEGNV